MCLFFARQSKLAPPTIRELTGEHRSDPVDSSPAHEEDLLLPVQGFPSALCCKLMDRVRGWSCRENERAAIDTAEAVAEWHSKRTMTMEAEEVRRKLDWALEAFLDEDRHLLENDLGERSIAARLAYHLQVEFEDDDLRVDVEYNREGNEIKRLALPEDCRRRNNRPQDPAVVPDIIVHKRGRDGPNVLVIEVKKTSNPEGHDCDRTRILHFREEIGYQFGALVECETRALHPKTIGVREWIPADQPELDDGRFT